MSQITWFILSGILNEKISETLRFSSETLSCVNQSNINFEPGKNENI